MTYHLKGRIRGGKNNFRIDPRTGRHFPTREWAEWRDEVVTQIRKQQPLPWVKLNCPIRLDVDYIPPDKCIGDIPGLADSLFHVLEHTLIENDGQIQELIWRNHKPDKAQAGAMITLEAISVG